MSNKKILLFGATGNMGGSVVKALLNDDETYEIFAITRNVTSPKAVILAEMGISVIEADFTTLDTIPDSISTFDFGFIVTPVSKNETELGMAAIKFMERIGVKHIIFNSVADSHNNTGIPHFENKRRIEEYLENNNVTHTTIGPVYIMDNLKMPWMLSDIKSGQLKLPLSPDRKLQMIAFEDVGKVVREVIKNSENYVNTRIDIASDELSPDEAIGRFNNTKMLSNLSYNQTSFEEYNHDMRLMYEWFENTGYSVDISSMKKEFDTIDFIDFKSWVNKTQEFQ